MKEKRSFLQAFKGLFVGLAKPSEYIENGRRASGLPAFVLILIVSLIVPFITFFYHYNKEYGQDRLANKIQEKVPDFTLDKNGLQCDDQYAWCDENKINYIRIDTRTDDVDKDEIDDLVQTNSYKNVIIACKKKIMVYSDGNTQNIDWSKVYDYMQSVKPQDTYTKAMVVDKLKTYDTPVLLGIYIFMVVATIIGYYISCIVFGILGLVINGLCGGNLGFGTLFKSVIYIKAIWYIIKKVLTAFVSTSSLISFAYVAIVLVILYLGIKQYTNNHKNDVEAPDSTDYPQPQM